MSTHNNKSLNDDKLLEQSLALKTASKQLLEQQLLSVVPDDDVDEEPMPEHGQALADARNEANWYKNEYVGAHLAKKLANSKNKFTVPHLADKEEVFEDEQKLLTAVVNSTKEVAKLMGTVSQYLQMIHHIYKHSRTCTADECDYEQACWRMQGLWWHTLKLEKRGRLDAGALASLWNKQLDLEMHMDYCTAPLCECTGIEQYRYFFMKRINDVRTGKIGNPPGDHPFANLLRHFKAKIHLALMNGKPDPERRSTAYLYYKLASMDIGPYGKEHAKTSWAAWTALAQGKQQPPAAAAAAAAPAARAPAAPPVLDPAVDPISGVAVGHRPVVTKSSVAPAAATVAATPVAAAAPAAPAASTETAARCRPVVTKKDAAAAAAVPAAPLESTAAVLKSGVGRNAATKVNYLTATRAPPSTPTDDNPIPPTCNRIDALVGGGQRVQLIEYPDKRLKRKDDPNGPYVTLTQLREEYKRSVEEKAEREFADYLLNQEAKHRKQTTRRTQPGTPCMTDADREKLARENNGGVSQQKPQAPCDHAVEKKCNCTYGEAVVEPTYENIEEFDKELRGAPPTKAEMDELRKRISEIVARRGVEADVKSGDTKSIVRVVTCSINGVRFRVAFQGDIHNHFNRARFNDTVAKYIFAGNFMRDVRILFYNFAQEWGSEGDKRMLALLKPVSKLALPYNLNYVSTAQTDELQVKFLLAREQVMKRAAVINAVEKAEKSKEKKAQHRREKESLWFSGTHVMVAGKDLKQNWKMRLEEDVAYFGNRLFYLCTLSFTEQQRTRVLMIELECLRVYAALARFDQVNENGTASEEIQKGRRYQQAVETKPLRTVKAQVNWVLSQKTYDISPEEDSERFVIEQMAKILEIGKDGGATLKDFMAGMKAMKQAGVVCEKEDLKKILASPEVKGLEATGKWPIDEKGCQRAPPDLYRLCQEAAAKGAHLNRPTQPIKETATNTAQTRAPVSQQQQPRAARLDRKPNDDVMTRRQEKIAAMTEQERHAEKVAQLRAMVGPCSDGDAEQAALGLDKMNQMIAEAQKAVSSSSRTLALSTAELQQLEKRMHERRHLDGGPTPPKRAACEQTKPPVETSESSPALSNETVKIDELNFDRILKVGEVVDESVRASSSIVHQLENLPHAECDACMTTKFDPVIAVRWTCMRKRSRGEDFDEPDEDTTKVIMAELCLWRKEKREKMIATPVQAFSEEDERQYRADEAYVAAFMEKVDIAIMSSPEPVVSGNKKALEEFTLDFDRILKVEEVVDESVRASSSIAHLLDTLPLEDFCTSVASVDPMIAIRWACMRKQRRGEQEDPEEDVLELIMAELCLWRKEKKGKMTGKEVAPVRAFSEIEERQHCEDEAYIAGFMEKVYADTKVDIETFERLWQFMEGAEGRRSVQEALSRLTGTDGEQPVPPVQERQTIRSLEKEIMQKLFEEADETKAMKGSENGEITDDSDLDEETKKYDEYFRQKSRAALETNETTGKSLFADKEEQERLSKLTANERAFENRTQQIVHYKEEIERLRRIELDTLLQCTAEREAGWHNKYFEPVKEESLKDYNEKLQETRGSLFRTKMNLKSALHANGRSKEAEEIDTKGEHEVRASCIVDDWCEKLAAMEKECERKITQAQKLTRKERMKVQAKVDPELKRIKEELEIMVKMKYDAAFWYEDKVASLHLRKITGKSPEDEDDSDLYSSDDGPYVSADSTADEEEEDGPNKGKQGIRSQPLPPIDDPSNRSDWSGDEDVKLIDDPNVPRRPITALAFWMGENSDRIRKPGMKDVEYARIAASEWMKVRDKSKWENFAMKDKQRYEKDLAAYRAQ